MVISRTKAELNRPQTDSKRPETGSVDQQNSKSDTSDTTPSREIRYSLSRTSDAGSRRKISPSEKLLTVSARSELAREKGSSATEMDTSGRSERTISEVPSLKDKDKDLSSSIQEAKSLGKSETSISKNIDLESTAKTRKADEQISRKLRQTLEDENKGSLREQQASEEAEIEDEAKTADDLSISEDSVARTTSKASRLENISQGSSKLFSVSRGRVSDSDAKSSIKTAEDLSVSEGSEIRTKSSRSESSIGDSSRKSIPKKTKNDISEQSSLAGERKRTVSDASKSSRHSKPPLMDEKSRSSRQVYSSSFESVQDEGDRTEDDISEHISIEERVQSSETEDSIRDERESSQKRDESKDFERTRYISDAHEDVVSVKDENSEIEEELPSTERTTSVFGNNRTTTQETEHSQEKEKVFLRPEVNEDQFPSYSADFEPSALDETDDGKSDNLKPDASYTPDFEERDDSLRSQAKVEDFSYPAQEKSHSESSAGDKKTLSHGKLERGKPQVSEDQKVPKVPSLTLEQATDEESVVEELGETHDDAYEVTDKEDSSLFFDKNDLQRIENNETSVLPVVHSDVPGAPELPDVLSAEQTADRIAEGLSAMLLAESVNCVTHMFEKRRQVAEDVTKTHGDVGEKKEQNDRASFKDDRDFFRWSAEDEVSEADIISLSEGEEPVSGLDFRSREQDELILKSKAGEDLFPSHVDKPQQDQVDEKQIQREQNESLVNKFSDTLLKEAASQMIAILKAKQAKFPESHKGKSTISVSTQKGVATEDEPHSEEESPLSSPRNNRFMAVQRFPDGVSKYLEDTATPPGSPTEERRAFIDEKELTDKLDQLRRLHEHLDSSREETLEEDENERLEFKVHTNEMIEFPAEEEDEEEIRLRSRAASFLFSVPHHPSEVSPVVASSLSVFFDRKRRGLPIGTGSPPSEIIGEDKADDDLESNSKRVYRRLVFDLSGNILKELLSEEVPPSLPPWMKAKRRRKRRLHRGLNPLVREKDYLPVVEQQVLNLIGLGDARPSLDRVRRKTPLKAGKKDFVDAILIQELREDEPLWIDYDDDELAVKFQVADAIFESLLSETVMVLNAVQMRREARADAYGS